MKTMKTMKNELYDLQGINKNTGDTGFCFNVISIGYSKHNIYFNSSTYEGKKWILNTDTMEVFSKWQNNKKEYSFTIINDGMINFYKKLFSKLEK